MGTTANLAKGVGALVLIVIIVVIALVASSLKKINSDEVALKYNAITKHLYSTPTYEGLHSGPPGYRFIIFPSVFSTLSFSDIQCLNKDGVEIHLSISYQYRVRGNDLESIITQFRDHDTYRSILEAYGESAIHEACCKFNTSQFQSERGAFQEEVRTRLVNKYNHISCDVTDLQVNDIRRPSRYENAVRSKESAREDIEVNDIQRPHEYEMSVKGKESAREDIEVARNERPRQLTEAETVKLEAETTAGIQIQRALSQARITENSAAAEAQAILNEYEKEAETYERLMSSDGLGLTPEAFLAYMGVRVIDEAHNSVNIALQGPAKTSWMTDS